MQLALKVYVNLHLNFSGTNLRIKAQPFTVTYYVVVDIEMMGELYNYKPLHFGWLKRKNIVTLRSSLSELRLHIPNSRSNMTKNILKYYSTF